MTWSTHEPIIKCSHNRLFDFRIRFSAPLKWPSTVSLFLFHHFIFLFVYYLVFHSSHSFICKVRSLLILSSYHFPTHFHLHVDLPQLYHTLPEPALDTSLKYPYHLSLYLFTPSSLSPLLSIYVSLFFLFFFCHHHSFSLSCDFFFCFLAIFCSLPSFISALLALMSVAMARSIQDGVFVLSAERKMNVAAMHHSLPCVWVCVISVWLACVLVYSSPCCHLSGLISLMETQGVVTSSRG